MPTKLPAILLCLVGLGLPAAVFAAEPVLQPTQLPVLRATPSRVPDRHTVQRPASDAAALVAALGQRPPRPRTLVVPLVKRNAIGVVIVRRF